jgi:L-asparaginase II
VALTCASHSGTDEHVKVVKGMQQKIGVGENDLMCGTHPPYHEETAKQLLLKGEEPSPNRHNCSGKHTGMLAHALLRGLPIQDYIDFHHPVQESILTAFAEMCGIQELQVDLGVDGCSAPNFAWPTPATCPTGAPRLACESSAPWPPTGIWWAVRGGSTRF